MNRKKKFQKKSQPPKKPHTPIDWSEAEEKARQQMEKNRNAIESGETFRGHQVTDRRSPGNDRGNRF